MTICNKHTDSIRVAIDKHASNILRWSNNVKRAWRRPPRSVTFAAIIDLMPHFALKLSYIKTFLPESLVKVITELDWDDGSSLLQDCTSPIAIKRKLDLYNQWYCKPRSAMSLTRPWTLLIDLRPFFESIYLNIGKSLLAEKQIYDLQTSSIS